MNSGRLSETSLNLTLYARRLNILSRYNVPLF